MDSTARPLSKNSTHARPARARRASGDSPDAPDLVTQHRELIFSIANQVQHSLRTLTPIDDLFGHGCVGLLEAAARFQPGRGAEFRTYVYPRIRGAILDGLRREGWQSRQAYANHRQAAEADLVSIELATPVLSSELTDQVPDEPATPIEEVIDLRSALERLPDAERAVLDLYYFAGMVIPEIAAELKMTKGWVSKLHARGIAKLKAMLESRAGC
jgi:RNA polymerase sigma factor for flagellar operon FliA